jgi:hypothetical protein
MTQGAAANQEATPEVRQDADDRRITPASVLLVRRVLA